MRDVRADVDDIVVELDDMLEAGADRGQSRLHVLERNLHLFAGVGTHPARLVDAKLTGEIDRAARSGHFHHMAVAGGFCMVSGFEKRMLSGMLDLLSVDRATVTEVDLRRKCACNPRCLSSSYPGAVESLPDL
jgi:hypothetical protein